MVISPEHPCNDVPMDLRRSHKLILKYMRDGDTTGEIARRVESSYSGVHRYLMDLQREGYLAREDGQWRRIRKT